jgi:hypothetical protein
VAEWLPFLAQTIGAKPPLRVPAWLGRLAVSWRQGFRGRL